MTLKIFMVVSHALSWTQFFKQLKTRSNCTVEHAIENLHWDIFSVLTDRVTLIYWRFDVSRRQRDYWGENRHVEKGGTCKKYLIKRDITQEVAYMPIKTCYWGTFKEIRSCRFEPWWSLVFPTVAFSQLCNAEAFNIGLENCPSPSV